MSKRWTQHDPRAGNGVSPDTLNSEFRAQQSSITTLDRTQLPPSLADENNITDAALSRVWASALYGTTGEQTAKRDTTVPGNGWEAVTYQLGTSGWTNAASTVTMAGFKGGSLYGEWSGNAMIFPAFASTLGNLYPGSPKYVSLRILVNGVQFIERRGVGSHEHFRIFSVGRFPQGDLSVDFQFKISEADPNEPISTNAGDSVPQAHLYSMRYFFRGAWR